MLVTAVAFSLNSDKSIWKLHGNPRDNHFHVHYIVLTTKMPTQRAKELILHQGYPVVITGTLVEE